jgi:hypothetical protein
MKRLLICLLTLVLPGAFSASAATVTVDLARFCADCARAGRAVQLKPVTVTARLDPTANQGLTDSAGVIIFTRVPAGTYTLVIRGVVGINGELLPDLAVTVPDTDAALQADDLVTSEWTRPPARVLSNVEFRGIDGSTNIFTFTNGVTAGDVLTTTDGVHWHSAAPSGAPTLDQIDDPTEDKTFDMGDNYLEFDTGIASVSVVGVNSDYPLYLHNTINSVSAGSNPPAGEALDISVATAHTTGVLPLIATTLLGTTASGNGGTTTEMRGIDIGTSVGSGHSVSRAMGINIAHATSSGSLTNFIGLEIADQTAGQTNYAIHTGTGLVSFGDKVSSTAGFASTATTAAVTIAATGWTNTFAKNAVVYYDGTNITAKVYNNAGTAIYTNTAALSGGSVLLQPSGAVILSGTGVNGRAAPF